MVILDTIALLLVIIGGINWGCIGLFDFNFVYALFGAGSLISNIILIAVGISALWCISLLFRNNRAE